MKNVVLGILIGFLLHKGVQAVYSYEWWTAELNCRSDVRNSQEPFVCIYEKLGKYGYLTYIINAPTYNWQKWEWNN